MRVEPSLMGLAPHKRGPRELSPFPPGEDIARRHSSVYRGAEPDQTTNLLAPRSWTC